MTMMSEKEGSMVGGNAIFENWRKSISTDFVEERLWQKNKKAKNQN